MKLGRLLLMDVLISGGGKTGVCVWTFEAGVDWEDGATILPLVKKRREVVFLAVENTVVVLGVVLGETAGAGLLITTLLRVEPDAEILLLHVGSGDSVDGCVLECGLAGAAVAGATASSAPAVGPAGARVVARMAYGVRLVGLDEAAPNSFEVFGNLGPGLVPVELSVLPCHVCLEGDGQNILVIVLEGHFHEELKKREFVGKLETHFFLAGLREDF